MTNRDLRDALIDGIVDNMGISDLTQFVYERLKLDFKHYNEDQLKTEIEEQLGEEYLKDVVDIKCQSNNKSNVTYNEVDYVEQCITEGHDYRDCVDTLVGNMVSNDNNGTVYNTTLSEEIKREWLYNSSHDSEGC